MPLIGRPWFAAVWLATGTLVLSAQWVHYQHSDAAQRERILSSLGYKCSDDEFRTAWPARVAPGVVYSLVRKDWIKTEQSSVGTECLLEDKRAESVSYDQMKRLAGVH